VGRVDPAQRGGIHEHQPARGGDDVRRLDVPVDQRDAVGPRAGVEQVQRLGERQQPLERSVVAPGRRQRRTVDVVHLDIAPAGQRPAEQPPAAVHPDQGGVVDPQQPAAPGLDVLGLGEALGPDQLEGAGTAGVVPGLPDLPLTAATDAPEQTEARDHPGPRRRAHCRLPVVTGPTS
jgi:hypothetical protein